MTVRLFLVSIMFLSAANIAGCSGGDNTESTDRENAMKAGDVLFTDPLNGPSTAVWKRPPARFEPVTDGGAPVYVLGSGENGYATAPAIAGDMSWESYRIEVELLSRGGGWTGIDFHVQDDGVRSGDVGVYVDDGAKPVPMEFSAWWEERLCFKPYPFAQQEVTVLPNRWYTLRIDVGRTVANVYLDDAADPCYTVYDLPFERGGIRFMTYYCEAGFRNLRVTALDAGDVVPVLPDPWREARGAGVVRDWQVTPPVPLDGDGDDTMPANPPDTAALSWVSAAQDGRGIVDLVRQFPTWHEMGAVYGRTVITADVHDSRTAYVTYTDRLKIWVNGQPVFTGPPREWFHPERELHGSSRLIPDQYRIELPLSAGANEVIIRSEQREPLFGWGFWMRLEDGE